MKVSQIAEFANTATEQTLGSANLVNEDLSNIVDVGKQILDANQLDAYVKSLVNHIGKVIFVDRVYNGSVPDILRDGWEYGSILEKISGGALYEAEKNDSWDLVNKKNYEEHIFYQPTATAKFWNSKDTYQIPISISEKTVKQSFSNGNQLNGFMSMIYNDVQKSLTVKMNELVMRVINTLIAQTIATDYPDKDYSAKSGVRAINLLKKYNDAYGTNLTPQAAYRSPEFIRYAAFEMSVISDRLTKINTVYNAGGLPRFTPKDLQKTILLSEFEKAAGVYLYSDIYHNEFVKLPNAETVPFFQGSNKTYDFDSISALKVTLPDGVTEVDCSGILGVIFDRDAGMVCNEEIYATSAYSARAEFYTNYYKCESSLFADFNEQCVVFFVA